MKLVEGITGFYDASERDGLPHVAVEIFKKEVVGALAPLGYKLVEIEEAGVTPNFHLALFEQDGTKLAVVCNSIYPYIALANAPEESGCELKFITNERIEYAIGAYTTFAVIPFISLCEKLTPDSLSCLNKAELHQVNYWRPNTVGEIIFNWWD